MATAAKRPPGGPPLMPRVVAEVSNARDAFRSSDIADRVGDPRLRSVCSMIGVLADRGLCHVVGYEKIPTGGVRCIYRAGRAPDGHVPPDPPARGGPVSTDRAPTQRQLEEADKEWRARARGAARFDAALSAIEAAQIRELKAWRAS